MGKPFDVEVDCGAATPVTFTLGEDQLRQMRDPRVRGALADKESKDDRTRLWNAALTVARSLIKISAGGPIEIFDGGDAWIIPEHSVRWVRVHDPEAAGQPSKQVAFRMVAARRRTTTRRTG